MPPPQGGNVKSSSFDSRPEVVDARGKNASAPREITTKNEMAIVLFSRSTFMFFPTQKRMDILSNHACEFKSFSYDKYGKRTSRIAEGIVYDYCSQSKRLLTIVN